METCVLCGSPDNDKSSDHLRECFKITQDKLSGDLFKPMLWYDEMAKLQRGFNPICSNRKKCRDRQKQNKRLDKKFNKP